MRSDERSRGDTIHRATERQTLQRCQSGIDRRAIARNASEIWKLDRFRRTIRASSSEDLSHCLSDTSQSTRCGGCSSTFVSLTSAETARRLGLTLSAVKARTFRARRSLRKYLEPKYGAAGGGFRSERRV